MLSGPMAPYGKASPSEQGFTGRTVPFLDAGKENDRSSEWKTVIFLLKTVKVPDKA